MSSTRAAYASTLPPKMPDAQAHPQNPAGQNPVGHNSPGQHPPVQEPLSRFDVAAARARARYSAEEWVLLDPGKRSTAIYAELRRIDGSFSR